MSPILNVIKYEGDNSTFIWKHPCEDFNCFSQLIVHESQEAIFFKDGQALDTFGPGRHTLETKNIPLVRKFVEGAVGGETPFHCEVYFINKSVQMGIKWGTDSKIRFIEPTFGIPLEIGACGELNLQVLNSRTLLLKLVGTMNGIAWGETGNGFTKSIQNSFKPLISNAVKVQLPGVIKSQNIDIFEIDQNLDTISETVRKNILPGFAEYGLFIPQFYIANIALPENDPNFRRLRDIHSVSLDTKVIQANALVQSAQADADAVVAAAKRKAILEKETTETEIAKREAERKMIDAQAEAQSARLKGLADAEVMAAKGYTQKDVLTADVQKAYAQGIGDMTISGTGGGVAGDMIGLGLGMAAAGAVAPQLQEMFNIQNNSQTTNSSIKCSSCGAVIPANSKFCPECGNKFASTVTCPNCNKEVPLGSKFCLECGYKFATNCPKCNKEVPAGSKFCLECGEKI